ncbi:MAG TPA: gamma-glutamyl-gamma-aminobutyrate hydrolase family protein [Methanospirillum sp.]|nr:gamma-glutamyl-gamma-aminobutyrate hydrolase family protein [Methanospirillum sp.]
MISIVDCTNPEYPLLADEYVAPLVSIVSRAGYEPTVIGLSDLNQEPEVMPDAVILSGTALADTWYRSSGLPGWFIDQAVPVLGICAGMQLLVQAGGGTIIPFCEIGMITVIRALPDSIIRDDSFQAYALHQSGVKISDSWIVVARSAGGVQAVRHQSEPWYGVLFHPEVRTEWVISRFLEYMVTDRCGSII